MKGAADVAIHPRTGGLGHAGGPENQALHAFGAAGPEVALARRMRTLPCLILLSSAALAALLAACGSSSNGTASEDGGTSAAASIACTTAMECNSQQCVCTDGETVETASACLQGSCLVGDETSFCASSCKSHGGVTTIRPNPNVATSAECDAWCTKGAALSCGSSTCSRFFFCAVPKGSCEAATRAALQCAVDKGEWACSKTSSSWSVGSSCPTFSELCTGTDGGAH